MLLHDQQPHANYLPTRVRGPVRIHVPDTQMVPQRNDACNCLCHTGKCPLMYNVPMTVHSPSLALVASNATYNSGCNEVAYRPPASAVLKAHGLQWHG